MIGAKTLAMLTLFAVEIAAALAFGVLAPSRVATRGFGTLCLVGGFGIVVGTLMFRFWRLGDPSAHYFRWSSDATPWERSESHFLGGEKNRITLGDNKGEAFDLPPALQHALCVAMALVLAFACIDARAVALLDHARQGLGSMGAGYCPDAEAVQPARDPNLPGCELIRRAYALGYADSLGECAPKAASKAPVVECTRRRRDEPLLHYSWRRLDEFWHKLHAESASGYFASLQHDFHSRYAHLDSMRRTDRQMLTSAPHAAHHIFTNLPDPDSLLDRVLRDERCDDRFRSLPHRPPADASPSRVFQHVLGQLLFESRYEPAAGSCREYHVHWSAPVDACQRLAADPRGFLSRMGALDSVAAVLDRRRVEADLAALNKSPMPPPASTAISFACYVEGDAGPRVMRTITIDGVELSVAELHVRPAGALFVDRYQALAQLLVSGFHYGRLLSSGAIAADSDSLAPSFKGHDYLLTRLYGLDDVDIYVDPGFLAARPDLLEVYPYQRHLKSLVQAFRRQYRQERGRL